VVIFDWGDSVIGHPAFDLIRMRDWREPAPELADRWCRFWRHAVPGSDPEHALDLLAPVAGLRDAVGYRAFLRSIEPAERPYHAGDVTAGLLDAVQRHRTHK
jgi:aminoglycoside phosphotransferase (APT) family kinase protein